MRDFTVRQNQQIRRPIYEISNQSDGLTSPSNKSEETHIRCPSNQKWSMHHRRPGARAGVAHVKFIKFTSTYFSCNIVFHSWIGPFSSAPFMKFCNFTSVSVWLFRITATSCFTNYFSIILTAVLHHFNVKLRKNRRRKLNQLGKIFLRILSAHHARVINS